MISAGSAGSAIHARNTGHPGLLHGILGGNLVAHQAYGIGSRADEHKAAFFDAFGEIGVLRQKAVARMDGLRIGDFSGADDGRDVQIALIGRRG